MAGFAYGAVMDLWDWAFFQGAPDLGYVAGLGVTGTVVRFGQFYLLTSAGYDAFRAVGNAAMILALGPAVLASLARLRARATFRVRRRRRAKPGPDSRRPADEALETGQGLGQVEPAEAEPDVVAGLAEARTGQEQDAFGSRPAPPRIDQHPSRRTGRPGSSRG